MTKSTVGVRPAVLFLASSEVKVVVVVHGTRCVVEPYCGAELTEVAAMHSGDCRDAVAHMEVEVEYVTALAGEFDRGIGGAVNGSF